MLAPTPARRALTGCLYVALATGTFYGFGMYSGALKAQFNLTQPQLDDVNTLCYLVGLISPLWGAVVDRFGARNAVLFGGAVSFSCQVIMYLVAIKLISTSAPTTVLVLLQTGTMCGSAFMTAAAFATPVRHFQQHRGKAVALCKSFVGMGGAVVSQLYVLLFGDPGDGPEALDCILLWAGLVLLCALGGAAVIPRAPSADGYEPRHVLRRVFWLLMLLGALGTAVPFFGGALRDVGVPLLLCLALAPIPLALFVAEPVDKQTQLQQASGGGGGGGATDELPPSAPPLRTFESRRSYSLREMLRTPDAWVLMLVASIVVGGGNVLSTNSAQLVEACGASAQLVPTVVTLFSTGNMMGRLTSPLLSDALVARGRSRAYYLVLVSLLMAAAHAGLLLAAAALPAGSTAQAAVVSAASAAVGYAFGSIWPHLVILCSELFGSRHLAANYMFYDGLCGATGTLLLANVLVGTFYSGSGCSGPKCFGPTHAVIAALCVAGAAASGIIVYRSSGLYRQIGKGLQTGGGLLDNVVGE